MTRTDWNILMLSLAAAVVVVIVFAAVAHAGPKAVQAPIVLPEPAKPITIKCPCVVTIQDGAVAIEPGAVLILSGSSLTIQGGHWSSDSAAVIQNIPPKPERDR